LIKPEFLVTGGTGLVGQSIVRKLVNENKAVRLISRRPVSLSHPGISVYQGDITQFDDLKNALSGCAGVIHCAGEKNDTKAMERINVTATSNLFSLAQDMNIDTFIHLSSVGVIGKTRSRIIDEMTQCNPMNMYEETKYKAENIVRQGLPNGKVIIIRPTNVFGPTTIREWVDSNVTSKVRSFIKGKENAHLVYVEDIADATKYLLENQSEKEVETYIISSDEEAGNTFHDIQIMLSRKIVMLSSPLPVSAPLFIPYYLRLIKNKTTNYGNKIYSSGKLFKTGFKYQYALQGGLMAALDSTK